jgi:hypothetical protein
MSQAEIIKIQEIIDQYRQLKIKFIQFVSHCETLLSDGNLKDIESKGSTDSGMLLTVLDTPVVVKFSQIISPEKIALGRVDFIKQDELDAGGHELVYSLYFNPLGNILESISDTFSNRRIFDEHDVPHVLLRFIQAFIRTMHVKEAGQQNNHKKDEERIGK